MAARDMIRCVAFLGLLTAIGCAQKINRTFVSPSDVATLNAESPFLKAHLSSGGVYVLAAWRVDSTSSVIVGNGTLLDTNRVQVAQGEFQVPTDSVVLFETNVEEGSGAKTALTIMTGVTAVIAGICASNPKTCFGSCPTFYAPSADGSMTLQAEGFSSSIAPGLEAIDVDMLLHARPTGRDFPLRITNEALETHVIRYADLLAVPVRPGGQAHLTSDGAFLETYGPTPPTRCNSPEGDCRRSLSAADGDERASLADSMDLATKESIDLVFEEVPDGALGLTVVSRQTLMTTFLIYQALAYMGSDAGRWLAMLQTGGEDARESARGIGRVLGDIDVLVQDSSGSWLEAGSVGETGPIATDTRVVRLPAVSGRPLRIRLGLTRGMWRLDQVALVSIGEEVTPVRIPPVQVTQDGVNDANALEALSDRSRPFVTLPGDEYEVSYRLPARPAEFQLFLEAKGYYLEWMRQEWIEEEDPLRAAQLFLDPAGALRALAPAFKSEEPNIERLFWNSRYVRN